MAQFTVSVRYERSSIHTTFVMVEADDPWEAQTKAYLPQNWLDQDNEKEEDTSIGTVWVTSTAVVL